MEVLVDIITALFVFGPFVVPAVILAWLLFLACGGNETMYHNRRRF
jgi:hypothetical protein